MEFNIKENLNKLPDTPGVYMHKDETGQVIYVGKAISLKRRVSQYFQLSKRQDPKVRAMVAHISDFEYITCKTEMEALILECNLIKKYEPKYNILLRDDKTYPYIKITLREDYPRVFKTRILKKDGSRYFGPYSDTGAVNRTVELLNKIFSLKRCSSQSFPENFRPCLNYHINECRGICTGTVDKDDYLQSVEKVIEFLSGRQKPILDYLNKKMLEASEKLDFEQAALYRDNIASVKALGETQRVSTVSEVDFDIILPVGQEKNPSVVLFPVREGKLSGRETFRMTTEGASDYETRISQFITQYYSRWAVVPKEIVLGKEVEGIKLLEQFLENEIGGKKVKIFVPKKGYKRSLLELAKRDVLEMSKTLDLKMAVAKEKEEELRGALEELTTIKKKTYRVEAYDISNTNGVDTVGAMVVFENFKPVKKAYRRFKIRTVDGPDDYGSLREMIARRFHRAKSFDPGFSLLPDFILMDGGQGQVTACEGVLKELGFEIPVLGMAKDDRHRTRALVDGLGREKELKKHPLLFKYCGTIQEEVHRFAIEYHRNLHNRKTIGSVLDNIRGIGPMKRNALLSSFHSIENIKQATVEELMKVEKINEKNAKEIVEYFQEKNI